MSKWAMPSFLTTIISIIAISLNNRLGWHLSPDKLIASTGLAINFVGVSILADIAKLRRGEKPNLNSTKLFTMLFACLIIGFSEYIGIKLDEESVWFIAGAAAAFISTKGIKDALEQKKLLTEVKEVAVSIAENVVAHPELTYEQIIPAVHSVHEDINDFYKALKENNDPEAVKKAIRAYHTLHQAINALKDPDIGGKA